jgi:molecular chaperone HtpG
MVVWMSTDSHRLTDSAVCLVADEHGMSTQLERMMAAMGQAMPPQKRVLELNAGHPAIVALRDPEGRNAGDERLKEYAEMLLDHALLAEGAPLKNPAKFARRIADVMAQAAAH